MSLSPIKYGVGIRDPGPGVKKAPDPGSRIRIRITDSTFNGLLGVVGEGAVPAGSGGRGSLQRPHEERQEAHPIL